MSEISASDYQVIIPAAGSSRRLKALTLDQPKSLLPIAGKPIIGHSLEVLDAMGLHDVVMVVGFKREVLQDSLGSAYKNVKIKYVTCSDYATTEHGWSLYQAREVWRESFKPVVLLDADNLYDPSLLSDLLGDPKADLCLVDDSFVATEREEELVTGSKGRIRHLVRGTNDEFDDCLGGFVGINKFSATFMGEIFDFMEELFRMQGRNLKYERVIDAFNARCHEPLGYRFTSGKPWLNINHESDLPNAERLADLMSGRT